MFKNNISAFQCIIQFDFIFEICIFVFLNLFAKKKCLVSISVCLEIPSTIQHTNNIFNIFNKFLRFWICGGFLGAQAVFLN